MNQPFKYEFNEESLFGFNVRTFIINDCKYYLMNDIIKGYSIKYGINPPRLHNFTRSAKMDNFIRNYCNKHGLSYRKNNIDGLIKQIDYKINNNFTNKVYIVTKPIVIYILQSLYPGFLVDIIDYAINIDTDLNIEYNCKKFYSNKNPYNICYILRERELVKTNEQIYKIGKTTRTMKERFSDYPNNSELIYYCDVDNCDKRELFIIKEFTKQFKLRSDIGNEYFEGNIDEMLKLFKLCCNYHIEE